MCCARRVEYPPRRRARKVAARKAIGPRKGPVMSKLARAYDALNTFNPDETLAEKLMGVVCAERQWLDATTGLDEDVVDAILTSGAVIALANVYQATALHDEEALIGLLRGQLRACRLRGCH
jgi:hypothetical protein